MSLSFACTQCGREMKTYVRAAGRKVRCPECTTLLVIPQPTVAETVAAAAGGDENTADLQLYDDLEIIEDFPVLSPSRLPLHPPSPDRATSLLQSPSPRNLPGQK